MSPIFNVRFENQDNKGPPGSDGLQAVGPTIPVQLSPLQPAGTPTPPAAPTFATGPLLALVDTGALTTCIDMDVAASLGLSVVDSRPMTSVTGTEIMPIYAVTIALPGNASINAAEVFGARLQKMGLAILLGRDVLRSAVFVYNGPDGSISLAI